MNRNLIYILQLIFSALLVILIMIQGKPGGLNPTFGSFVSVYRSKRGLEKIIFYATIAVAAIFFLLSAISFIFY